MTHVLFLDTETRNATSLDVGVYRYAESVEVCLVQFALDHDPVIVWDFEGEARGNLQELIDSVDTVVCHNMEFDRTVLSQYGIYIPIEKQHCTMAQARRHGLPGGLDKLCDIFRLPADKAKMKDSKKLSRLFYQPRPDGTWATQHTHPNEYARFLEYARLDCVAMRELYFHKLPRWNESVERPIWELDQRINVRGFAVDSQLAHAAVKLLEDAKDTTNAAIVENTDGAVTKGTQRERILLHILREYDVTLPDLTASTIDRRINDQDLPDAVRELLALRQQSAKTSTGKYATLLKCVSSDGRLRGSLVYSGATRTSRWSGAKFQPHNLPRPDPTVAPEEIDRGIRAIKVGVVDLVGAHPVTKYASWGLRGVVVAAPGCRLLVSDLSNIEGRVIAWLAGEERKLEAFRDFDAGKGPDLYRLAYARAFGISPDAVTGGLRQVGKVMELMLGYGGGVGAFITGADTYHVNLDELAEKAWPTIPRGIQIEAEKAWWWAVEKGKALGLEHDVYVTCDALKRLWRERHPQIVQFWADLEDAAARTIRDGGPITVGRIGAGRITFDMEGAWLRMQLPAGGYLCYPGAKVSDRGVISFMGQSPYSRTWARQKTWGGTLAENATQKVARDVLAFAMLEIDEFAPIVLHVHDEPVAEVDADSAIGHEFLTECLTRGFSWTTGLPLAAKGFETLRYRKAD